MYHLLSVQRIFSRCYPDLQKLCKLYKYNTNIFILKNNLQDEDVENL